MRKTANRSQANAVTRLALDALGLKQVGGEIALAGIAKDHHNHLAASETLGDLQGGTTVGARGDADQYSFFARQTPRVLRRLFVAYGDDLLVDVSIEVLRHETRADALYLVKTRLATGQNRRILRFDRDDERLILQM